MRRSFKVPPPNPAVIKQYLERPLRDFDFLKSVPKEELYENAKALGHRFATDPWHNQLVCFTIAAELNSFLFFLKMGGGKSSIGLNQIRYRKRRGELTSALVLVPELLHVISWEEQLKTHAPDLSYRLLIGDRKERETALTRPADVFVMNYKGLEVYMSERITAQGARKSKQVVDPDKASKFVSKFNFVLFDESHRLGNHQSLVYELASWLAANCDFRYALTGTPFGRDPAKLWPQFKLIDQGETLGRTLGIFRNVFFEAKDNYWKGVEYVFNKEMTSELHRVIKNRSITYELHELRDMPPKQVVKIPVPLSGEGLGYYKRILEGVAEARGDYRTLGNLFVRMRQCASGFLSMKSDDDSRIEVQFKDNPKLDRLKELILDKDEKILVFHEYTHSGKLIEKMLEDSKIGYSSLRGGTKDPKGQYDRFLKDPKCKVFVLNNTIGSEAINPQYVCRRAVFYESPVSPIQREQAEGRVHRPGQQYPTFIYDLIVPGTIEEKILLYIRDGQNLLKAVLSGAVSLEQEETADAV